jgi:hypothetical protein
LIFFSSFLLFLFSFFFFPLASCFLLLLFVSCLSPPMPSSFLRLFSCFFFPRLSTCRGKWVCLRRFHCVIQEDALIEAFNAAQEELAEGRCTRELVAPQTWFCCRICDTNGTGFWFCRGCFQEHHRSCGGNAYYCETLAFYRVCVLPPF